MRGLCRSVEAHIARFRGLDSGRVKRLEIPAVVSWLPYGMPGRTRGHRNKTGNRKGGMEWRSTRKRSVWRG